MPIRRPPGAHRAVRPGDRGVHPRRGGLRCASGPERNSMTGDSSTTPWTGDACSLVDAFRAGERSPVEELDATLAAIEASRPELLLARRPRAGPGGGGRGRRLAAVRRRARPASRSSSRSRGGRCTEASLVFQDRIADLHVAPRRAAARAGRRRARRPDDGERVRRAQRERHQDQRRHPQPVAARPHRRAGRRAARRRRSPAGS